MSVTMAHVPAILDTIHGIGLIVFQKTVAIQLSTIVLKVGIKL